MKKIGYLIGCLCAVVLLAGCSDKEDVKLPEVYNRTVLVYMAADNNLGDYNGTVHFAQEDLEEMKDGVAKVAGTGFHLLVYKDFRRGLEKPVLVELVRRADGTVREEVVRTYEERNSVGVKEMQEVFGDVFANPDFQAESYGLVYWSHGDGWIPFSTPNTRWIGEDGGNHMNISGLVEVLEYIPNLRLDFILFDACFMQSVEVAYELRPFAEYLIASPTETPGPGAPYDAIVPAMFLGQDSKEVAETYFQVYNALYNGGVGISNSNWTGGVSMAVTQLSALAELAAVTRQCLSKAEITNPAVLRMAGLFDYDKRVGKPHVGYYDFLQLMQQVLPVGSFAVWQAAYNRLLTYWKTTPMNYSGFTGMFSMEGSNGVTHYIPMNTDGEACMAYRQTGWYQDAGLAQLGW